MTIEEIKNALAKEEKALANPKLMALMGDKIQAKVDGLKKQLEALENKAEEKVEVAEEKVAEAKKDGDKPAEKKAEKEVKEAKAEVKEVEKVAEKADKVSKKADKAHGGTRKGAGRKPIEKMEKPKGQHGGKRPSAGRKGSSSKKIVKPKGAKVTVIPMRKKKVAVKKAKVSVREKLKAKKAVAPKKLSVRERMKAKQLPAKVVKATPVAKVKSVRAFGQTVEYKNDADFCSQLIKAFKKRKVASKKDGKRRKTKPVFGVIVNSTKNAVSKALHSVSTKEIEKNPKQFLAKATRLEKSAVRFLEDFKAILGSDYKKSEISAEFGELEKAIKSWVTKFTKK